MLLLLLHRLLAVVCFKFESVFWLLPVLLDFLHLSRGVAMRFINKPRVLIP